MFNELYRCCLQQLGLTVSLWKAIYSLGNSLIFGDSHDRGLLWPTTHLDIVDFQCRRASPSALAKCLVGVWQDYPEHGDTERKVTEILCHGQGRMESQEPRLQK